MRKLNWSILVQWGERFIGHVKRDGELKPYNGYYDKILNAQKPAEGIE